MSKFQYPNAQQECFSKWVRKREHDKNCSNEKKKKIINGNKKINSNIVITDCNKNKDNTVIHGNINNKETN